MESQNDRELAVLQELGTTLKNVSQKKQHDEDDLFAELLASQLRNLPVHEKPQVKMRINQLVYEALMKNSANSARAASCAPTCTTPASINYPWQMEASTGFTPEGSQGYTIWPASSTRYTNSTPSHSNSSNSDSFSSSSPFGSFSEPISEYQSGEYYRCYHEANNKQSGM